MDKRDGCAVTSCVGYDLRSGRPCERLAVSEVVLGCMHEHVASRCLCAWHIHDVENGNHHCGDCAEAGCDCRLQVKAAMP